MYCSKCGKRVEDDSFYCKWCGALVNNTNLDIITKKIKQLLDSSKKSSLIIAFLLNQAYKDGHFLKKYTSIAEYGQIEFGLQPSTVYKYKRIAEKFMDSNGKILLSKEEEWGIGNLIELLRIDYMSIERINTFIDKNIIDPRMKQKDFREAIEILI